MKKKSTKPAPTRCLWQQGFRDALQRLSVTLMLVMLTATTAWAKLRLRAYTEGELSLPTEDAAAVAGRLTTVTAQERRRYRIPVVNRPV